MHARVHTSTHAHMYTWHLLTLSRCPKATFPLKSLQTLPRHTPGQEDPRIGAGGFVLPYVFMNLTSFLAAAIVSQLWVSGVGCWGDIHQEGV